MPDIQLQKRIPSNNFPLQRRFFHQINISFKNILGNTWAPCGNGTGAIGCGDQETFRNCADIKIMSNFVSFQTAKKSHFFHI